MKKLLYMLPAAAMLVACAPQTYVKKGSTVSGGGYSTVTGATEIQAQPVAERKPLTGMMPKATAFKMSGDYAGNVAITLGADGKVAYYPAPSDISKKSAPTSLGDGWYLNNQGLGQNSVFTKYTFEEYGKLPAAPSPGEMKDAVIPGARVTEMVRLPFSINDANKNLQEIKDYLKSL